jgi:hypothetical protein
MANGRRGILSSAGLIVRAVDVLARVIKRFIEHRDHGLYPTVVEEILRAYYIANIGEQVWQAMKQETADTFAAPTDVPRGGTEFLNRLEKLLNAGQVLRLSVVGHSTGAVFIDNFFDAIRVRQAAGSLPKSFKVDKVIFLVPAATDTNFANVLGQPLLYNDFRLFGMTDGYECKDEMVPAVYTRSLLYFVSGILEENADGTNAVDMPIMGMQRYLTEGGVYNSPDAVACRTYLTSNPDFTVWSPCDRGDGLRSQSQHHGDFDDDDATLTSVQYFLR